MRSQVRQVRIDVLMLNDWALAPTREQERRDLLELLEARYSLCSTVIASQLPTANWDDYVGHPTVADAICDRILHNDHRVPLWGAVVRPAPILIALPPMASLPHIR